MKKVLLRFTLYALALLAGLSATVGWLCSTSSGLQYALAQLNHIPGITVKVNGVQGKLAGPLHLEQFTLDHKLVHIDIQDVDLELTPAFLLAGLVEVNRLTANRVQVHVIPSHEKPQHPVRFFTKWLHLSVDDFYLKQVTYKQAENIKIDAAPIRGSVDIAHDKINFTRLSAQEKNLKLQGDLSLHSALTLSLNTHLETSYQLNEKLFVEGDIDARGPVTGNSPELVLEVSLKQPHQLSAKGVLRELNQRWFLQGDITAERLLLDPWINHPSFSIEDVGVHFDLSDTGMRYSGRLKVPEWSDDKFTFKSHVQYADQILSVKQLELGVLDQPIQLSASGQIVLKHAENPVVDVHGEWRDLYWPLKRSEQLEVFSSRQGAMKISGTQPYHFELTGQFASPRLPESTVQLAGRLLPHELDVQRYQVVALGGILTGSANIDFKLPQSWRLDLLAKGINTAGLNAKWPALVDIRANAQGQGFKANSSLDVSVTSVSGTLRGRPVKAAGRLMHRADQWTASGVDITWGDARLTAQGSSGAHTNLTWILNAPTLSVFNDQLSGDALLSGSYTATQAVPQVSLQIKSNQVGYQGIQLKELKLATLLDLSNQNQSMLEVTAQRITHEQSALTNVKLVGEGRVNDHELILQAQAVNPWLPESMQVKMKLGAGYDKGIWQGSIESLQADDTKRNVFAGLLDKASFILSEHHSQLEQLCLVMINGKLCGAGDWQRDELGRTGWRANIDVNSLPFTLRNSKLINGARLESKLQGRIAFGADLGMPWKGESDLKMQDAKIYYTSVAGRDESLPIETGKLHLVANDQVVRADGELRVGEQTVSAFDVSLDRTQGTQFTEHPLSGILTLSSSDAKLIPVFIPEVDRAQGTVAAILRLAGTVTEPKITGNMKLVGGELDFYHLNLALRGISFDAQIAADQLDFNAQANAGEGVLAAAGKFKWLDSTLLGTLSLKGNGLLLADLPEYRVVASPDLQFDIKDKQVRVSGDLVIPEARVQPKEIKGAIQLSADARYKDQVLVERKQIGWKVDSDTRIKLGDSVILDSLGLHGRISGEVVTHLHGNDKAEGTGELNVTDGSYEVYGQKLSIKRGQLLYENSPLSEPGLNIQAERTSGSTTVGVNVRGLLREPRFQFYSTPAMSQNQVLSYLLVGKQIDELQTGETTKNSSAGSALAMQGGGYLAARMGKQIGIEQVNVETDSKNQSSLVLGKFLSPRLFVSYGISLTQAINTMKLRYTLGEHWSLKSELGAAKGGDLEFKIDR